MKRIFKKTAFFVLIAFTAFALVASNGITHRTLSTDIQQLEDCLIADSLGSNGELTQTCIDIQTSPSTVSLTDQQRFLAAITDKLPTIPQAGTFEYILLRQYGAAFVNQDPVIKLPAKVIFANDQETKNFQATLTMGQVNGASNCYLQKLAADALNRARSLLKIPLKSGYGASDCTRTFTANVRFWRKYANDKTLERVRQGKETAILSIVAPPGTSQHLWGLAVDLRVSNDTQTQALNQNGWFRTVENDVPHWTYVGLPEENLPQFGFKNKVVRGITYWVTPL